MIKNNRTLHLSRSTLRRLDDDGLRAAAGGGVEIPRLYTVRCPPPPPLLSTIYCPQ